LHASPRLGAASRKQIGKQLSKGVEADNSSNIANHPTFQQQAALIDQLLTMNKRLYQRVDALETKLSNILKGHVDVDTDINEVLGVTGDEDVPRTPEKRRITAPTFYKDTWYTGDASNPRSWAVLTGALRHKNFDMKSVVAYMKIFLYDGFVLENTYGRYRDYVIAIGRNAVDVILGFLRDRSISSRGTNVVLTELRTFHSAGELNHLIVSYRWLVAVGRLKILILLP
jgi:hypothetical protein